MYDTGRFWPFKIKRREAAMSVTLLAVLVTAEVARGTAAMAAPVKNAYDDNTMTVKVTYPNHRYVTRVYDSHGRLKEVTDWNSRTTKFFYDSNSNLTAIAFPPFLVIRATTESAPDLLLA